MSERLLGVDIGGTGIKVGAVSVDPAPRLLASRVLEGHPERDPRTVLPELAGTLRRLCEEAGWDDAQGVGVGCAGLVRTADGALVFSPNLPAWEGFPLREGLAEATGLSVHVDNDVNTFAVAEWLWGAARGVSDALFLTVGTGIGGAALVGGRLLRGAQGFAGEPGHTTVMLDGVPCPCGNRGCAERYVGKEGLVDAVRAHPAFDEHPALVGASPLTPKVISAAAAAGSVAAAETLHEAGRVLGALLVTLVNVFNPERVVIGGGIAQAGDRLLDPARELLMQRSLVARHAPPRILPAALSADAGVFGAAGLLLESAATD
jgi:glucokinase